MIYLFNIKDELIHILNENDLIEFYHKKKINSFDESSFDIPLSATYKEIISKAAYFGFHDNADFKIMKVLDVTYDDIISVHGLDRAESDLRTVRIIKDKRLIAVDARSALGALVENTFFSVGSVDGITRTATLNYYYISPLEALTKLVGAFNCEFVIRYNFVENRISSRYIDLYNRQGKYSGKQFYHGSDLLKVKMKQDNDSVITALIGRGKGEEVGDGYGRRIEFTDVVWGSDKPLVKPAGQNYIAVDPGANGVMVNGKLAHRWGVYVNDKIEDANELLEDTYQQLIKLSKPLTVYEADVIDIGDDISLGDSVAIIRDDVNITFQARIFEINIDKLNNDRSTVKLGDYELLSFNPTLDKVQGMIDDLNMDGRDAMLEAFNEKLEEQKRIFDEEQAERIRLFNLEMDNKFIEAENKVTDQNEALREQLQSKIEAEATKSQELIDEFKQSFDATKHDLLIRINEGSPDVSALRNEFNSEISELRTEATRLTNEVREEANNLVNNIKVGSRNYILNSGTIAGNNWYNRGANWQLQNDVYLNLPIFSWVGGRYKETPIANVTVKTGETYTFSCWVKRDSPGRLHLYLYDTTFNNDARLDIRRDHTFENNAEWQFIKITFTATRDGLIKIRYVMVNSDNGGFSFTPFMLERGNISTDWRPAPEDVDYTRDISDLRTNIERTANGLREDVTRINQKFDNSGSLVELSRYKTEREATDRDITTKITEYRQTVDGQIATVRGIANDSKALASNFRQEIDNINLSVSSLNSDTVKYADIDVSDNGVRFGSRVEIDGNTLGSIISLSPDGIRAVADKMIITANNENLVRLNCKSVRLNQRYVPASVIKFSDELKNGDEFLINMQYGGLSGAYPSISIGVVYDDNSKFYIVKEIPHANNGRNVTLKIAGLTKKAKEWWIDYHLNLNSDFPLWIINNCVVYKKKSAELIVDGSITTDKFNANEIVAGSTFTNMIKSIIGNFDYANIGNATIDNAKVTNMSLVELITKKIIAHEAFINKIKATTIDASKITSGVLGIGVRLRIGSTGYIEPYETGVRTVIPTWGNRGVAIHQTGYAYGNMEKGVNIYNLDDTVNPDRPKLKYNETLLTVHGQVKIGLPLNSADVGGDGTKTLLGYAVGTNTANNTPVRPVGFTSDGGSTPTFSSIRWVGWFWGSSLGGRIVFDHGNANNYETFMVRIAEAYSDIKLKKNIEKSDVKALDVIENLKFKQFDWNDESKLTAGQPHVKLGLIAQEVELLDSDLVTQANKYKELEHFKLTMYALKAIQELSEKINRLEKKLYAS